MADPRNPKRPEGLAGANWARCRDCGRGAHAMRLIRHSKTCAGLPGAKTPVRQ